MKTGAHALKSVDLGNPKSRATLPARQSPYWYPLANGRSLGYVRRACARTHWLGRYRAKDGRYKQAWLAWADDGDTPAEDEISLAEAIARAGRWFLHNAVHAGDPNPLGGMNKDLIYTPVGPVYTLGHALRDYVEWKRIRSAETHFKVIIALINYHILPRLGPLALTELRADHFRSYFRQVLETAPKRGNKPSPGRFALSSIDEEALRKRKKTVNALITILRDTLQLAWEDGKSDNDRLWRSLRSFPNVDRPKMVHLSRAECRSLLELCPEDLRTLVTGALYTGCRSIELLRMRASDVGRDGYGVYVLPSKTRTPRFVFLPDEGMDFFLRLAAGKRPEERLFLRADGQPWGESFRPRFKVAVRAADLPPEFSFHGLRHTYASQLVQAGTPLMVVAEQLGHVNTVTVSRTYGHVSPQIRESEVRQRFPLLSRKNAKLAAGRGAALARWRKSFQSSNWRSYADINRLKET